MSTFRAVACAVFTAGALLHPVGAHAAPSRCPTTAGCHTLCEIQMIDGCVCLDVFYTPFLDFTQCVLEEAGVPIDHVTRTA